MDIDKREARSIIPERNMNCELAGKGKIEEEAAESVCAV